MSDGSSIGQAIYQSVQAITHVGQQIESLMSLIKNELNSALEAGCLSSYLKVMTSWQHDWRYESSGWVCTDSMAYIGVKEKGSRVQSAQRYLVIQFSLAGDGMTAPNAENHEPLVHVSLWDSKPLFDDEYFGPEFSERFDGVLQDDVLFNWCEGCDQVSDQVWTYSIKLAFFESIQDIHEKIIDPVNRLLRTNSAIKSELSQVDGVVKYTPVNETVYQVS